MAKVIAVCTSQERGTQKENIHRAELIEDWGIKGDAHAGKWHRQVSLLSYETIEAFRKRGADVADGAFGENLVVSGYDFTRFPVGSRFSCGEVILELTQIGKECHNGCAIFQKMGECIMPHNGVFARVVKGGTIAEGDTFQCMYRTAVITLSDSASKGEREDISGKVICGIAEKSGCQVTFTKVIPDDEQTLSDLLCMLCDKDQVDLILTTGGTGFSERDHTPEATLKVLERNADGISEAMRYRSLQVTPRGMLSRGVSGIRKKTLIINLPGSPKAVRECLEYVIDPVMHGLDILKGVTSNCAG